VTGSVTIRKCEALEEMQACFALQKEVWNFTDAELVPIRVFVVANKIGGQVVGALTAKSWSVLRWLFRVTATDILICTRRCWRFGKDIGTAAWDGALSSISAKTPSLEASNLWNGRLIH